MRLDQFIVKTKKNIFDTMLIRCFNKPIAAKITAFGWCFLFGFFLFLFSSFSNFSGGADSFGVKTVVIDAGHGGHDGGCEGAFSNEKNVALAISLKLGAYIEENFPDVEVIYTRKTDVFIELAERAAIANKAKADLFICIHANAGGNPSACGTETYVMGLSKSNANMEVAKRENSAILLEENYEEKYQGFDPNVTETYIALTMMQNAFLDQSLNFAAKIQYQFTERVGRKNRGVKQAGFLVLHQTSMPSVLIETGFLTNKEEEKFLNSDLGQDYMSSAIYRAFKEYKHEIEIKSVEEIDSNNESVDTEKASVEKVEHAAHDHEHKEVKKKNELVFMVQIATSSQKKKLTPDEFNGVEGVQLYKSGGVYRYVVGEAKNMDEAHALQIKMKQKGFQDAFIVAFKDGERIPISEAISIQKSL